MELTAKRKNYKLTLNDFLTAPLGEDEKRRRQKLPYKEKQWVVESSYSMRDENDTTLFITSIDIDFETKHIIVEF